MYTIFHDELSHLPYLTGRDQERSSNMAKNFGKILLGLTAAGAAGAGAYYWLKNRHNEEPEDEFDDTFEDDNFELDDDLGEVPERGYTTLTPSSAKEDNEMSKENAEQLLNSVMQDEKDVQDKVKKQQVLQGGRLEKDW